MVVSFGEALAALIVGIILVVIAKSVNIEPTLNKILYIIGILTVIIGIIFLILALVGMVI